MRYLFLIVFLMAAPFLFAQDPSNIANMTAGVGNTGSETKITSMPVNWYTGMPSLSVPIYTYSNSGSGLTWPVSLSYFAGGIQLGESVSSVGMGWNFNASGAITRTVRGMPDDMPTYGFLYSGPLLLDCRSAGNQYATDSLDAQQDVFQFSFKGRSGQFMIGKNKQIIQIPNTKLKITYNVSSVDHSSIISFRIVSEDGTVYDFATGETTRLTGNGSFTFGYSGKTYGSSWWLTDVIAPFGTDTIRFNYTPATVNTTQSYPQYSYQNDGGGAPIVISPTASATINTYNLSSITFPDNKSLQVVYNQNFSYPQLNGAVAKIKVYDSIFRFGFALQYHLLPDPTSYPSSLYLSKVIPYTAYQQQEAYSFGYEHTYTPNGSGAYAKDYWGFYNGVTTNQNFIPNSENSQGANRNPNATYVVYNTLSQYYKPGEGYVHFYYEPNDRYPLIKTTNSISIDGTASSTTSSASFGQVFGTKQQITLTLDSSVPRTFTAPFTGSGWLTLSVKSTDGSVQYASLSFGLLQLFYQGSMVWQFNVPNGAYQITSSLDPGTTFSGPFPINLAWESRTTDNSQSAATSGGVRVKRITRGDAVDDEFLFEDIQYLTEDGKSSGILGDLPSFSYPYTETVYNGSTTTTTYKMINSDPTNSQDYSQGTYVGYSRVIVFKGTATHNLGKTVYEFTGPADVNCNISTRIFPYTPVDLRSWGMGLPKRTSVYDDSSGRLVKRTVNTYRYDTVTYNSPDFTSQQLGNNFTQVYPGSPGSPRVRSFIGQQYYATSGQYYVTSTTDTLYQADGSASTSYRNYVYDTNYNVTKVTTSYDRTRGLQMETRYYYPYNYTIGGAIGTLRDSGILGPVISTENWIIGDTNPRIIAGGITEFQQLPAGYIKPLRTYALQAGAPVPQTAIGSFDSSRLNRNTAYWIAQDSFPVYSSKGNLLQATSAINKLSSLIIRDYNDEYAVATVSNATYGDVAYTSFESDGSGNWTIGSTQRDYSGALTGKKAYNLSNGNVSRSGLNSGTTYIVSLWAKNSASAVINGVSQTSPIASQNGWNLFFTMVSGVTSVTVSGAGPIDELRLYPKDANMATTAYEPLVGPTATCDANNTVTYTSYDLLGRPKLIKDKDLNIIKRFDYADVDSLINTAPILSRAAAFQWDPSFPCGFDSVITLTDVNPWSDSYNSQSVSTVFQGYNYCSCSLSDNYPMWKNIGGVCTLGVKQYLSCVYKSELGGYQCYYQYLWPDCSVSAGQYEIDATPQTVTSGCPPPGGFPQP